MTLIRTTLRKLRRAYAHRVSRLEPATEFLRRITARQLIPVSILRYALPHSSDFDSSACKSARRYGLNWNLQLRHHFQWRQYFGFPDEILDHLVEQISPGDVVLDIGANVGFYSLILAHRSRAVVHAFEPVSSTFQRFQQHLQLNPTSNVIANQLAMGARAGTDEITLTLDEDSGRASLCSGVSDGASTESIDLKRVDDYVDEHSISKVDLIKIDVEGYEGAVVRGARRTIERDHPTLVVELTPSWMNERDKQAIIDLEKLGYRVRLLRGHQDFAGLQGLMEDTGQYNLSMNVSED
jgi:FkbM family methyltransferase